MKNKKEEEILKEGNISLILDSYEDIFSDFDARPSYIEKALSADFLDECKRAAKEKEEGVELRFMVPKHKRNTSHEYEIRKRLRNHFQKHFKEKERERKILKRKGGAWFLFGIIIIVLGAQFLYDKAGLLFRVLFTMAEAGGWFISWEGLGKLLADYKEKSPDYDFYRKMAKAKIYFLNY